MSASTIQDCWHRETQLYVRLDRGDGHPQVKDIVSETRRGCRHVAIEYPAKKLVSNISKCLSHYVYTQPCAEPAASKRHQEMSRWHQDGIKGEASSIKRPEEIDMVS
ncbi:uncharacterized protein MCYG_06909 [Microsporum canis CBS 113480]|uniref:Uncharacterized protein n=1 Tax=Arthroderma otae (strain ATCC MYA-4605 / CBS 113480) TaxID=554155 RepID=C5FW06_ARTOC|nr:uncharacterized protein MCYG_06909 [Microsporum canis CBS 113480]EEQ34090.1 predicted protein [Microsporum canis CBS 113480]